jgi:RNA-binding protein
MTLTPKQKQDLKKQAHHLKPQIQIGKNSLTTEQTNNIKQALKDHQLIKIKFNTHKDQKQTLTQQIIDQTGAEQIDLIGNTLIIYKQNPAKPPLEKIRQQTT